MDHQHKVIEPVDISDISEECRSECECETLHSWYSDEEDKELDKIHRFEEKKIIYELYREGKFDYNQLNEMLELVR